MAFRSKVILRQLPVEPQRFMINSACKMIDLSYEYLYLPKNQFKRDTFSQFKNASQFKETFAGFLQRDARYEQIVEKIVDKEDFTPEEAELVREVASELTLYDLAHWNRYRQVKEGHSTGRPLKCSCAVA